MATIEGTEVEPTNLDKVFYPETACTKAQVIDCYRRAAPYILPHLQGRPVMLKRCPDGVTGHSFYEKSCPPAARGGWRPRAAGGASTSTSVSSRACPRVSASCG